MTSFPTLTMNTYNLSILETENVSQNSTNISENLARDHDNMTSSTSNELLLIFLDRSQLVMTIIGVIANIGTSFVLFANGQVSKTLSKVLMEFSLNEMKRESEA